MHVEHVVHDEGVVANESENSVDVNVGVEDEHGIFDCWVFVIAYWGE